MQKVTNRPPRGIRGGLLLLLLLCSLSAARGQTDWKNWHCDYWFDNDLTSLREVKTCTNGNGSDSFQIDADVSGLSEGLHSINIQALGYSNVITGFERVRNDDYSEEVGKDVYDAVVTTERKNLYSVPVSRYFVKMAESNTARVWFDNDVKTLQTGVRTGEPLMLDVKSLKDGLHFINIQAEGADNGLSNPKVYPFVKVPQVLGVDHLTCLCMIDDQLYKKEQVPANGGIVSWQFDVSSLPQGFHRIYVQVVTPSGAASALYQGFFFRETTRSEFGEMKCVYAIDGSEFNNEAGTLANGTFHFDLDVAGLTDGLHRLSYMLSNGKGVTTKVQTQFFTKIPLGGYGTVEYWYWLNNLEDDAIHKTKVDPRQNPFSLIALLPVDEVPIRSSCFEFRIVDGQPTIFAKNDFHARFYDASGRFVDLNREYVDERVSQKVNETTLLEAIVLGARRGPMLAPAASTIKSVTLPKPSDNAITWFKMEAEPGDSLQFHLNRAATMQLFAPSGKEVYKAQGAESVQWGGIHAEELGTYYLAVHDVTATYGSQITLYYEFIDHYAVLRQDIATVGNGGPSTITFQGNGFDELTKVQLKLGSTVLNGFPDEKKTNATTGVKFDFGGAPIGEYDAVFYFGDEEITIEKCITVEQAVPVIIDGYVSYNQLFLVSRGNEYVCHITNHGNQTAYDQRFMFYVYTANAEDLEWVSIDGTVIDGTVLDGSPVEDVTPVEGLPCIHRYIIDYTLRPSTTEMLVVKVKTKAIGFIHVVMEDIGGGTSKAVNSLDPNDIYGYVDENGTKYIKEGLTDVYYTIEFENDPAFATASAHDIYVTDQLDADLFDLSTFMPTRIKIGDREVKLTTNDISEGEGGLKFFVVTIDMRPEINAVAEVKCEFDPNTGLAQWHIGSLDPMTMEPTTEPIDGVLPVNSDGNGIGQVSFDISLKPGLPTNTEIPNKAIITFDTNAPIETPTWVNIIGQPTIIIGDINNDDKVDVSDYIGVANYILGNPPEGFNKVAADVNGDGLIDVSDYIGIANIILTGSPFGKSD